MWKKFFRSKRNADSRVRTCVECGDGFTLMSIEISGYRMKELPIPDRCRACRNQARDPEKQTSYQPTVLRRAVNH